MIARFWQLKDAQWISQAPASQKIGWAVKVHEFASGPHVTEQVPPPQLIRPSQASWLHCTSQLEARLQSTARQEKPQRIVHAPAPQVMTWQSEGPQVTSQSVAAEQSTSRKPLAGKYGRHGRPAGHVQPPSAVQGR